MAAARCGAVLHCYEQNPAGSTRRRRMLACLVGWSGFGWSARGLRAEESVDGGRVAWRLQIAGWFIIVTTAL